MCGIAGIWGPEPERARLEAMVEALRHRGPDDEGLYANSRVALGMARLAVIDLSPAASQPMSNADKTVWIVYNGETYNFRDLRRELEAKGCEFTSNSDTEVVLKLYEHFGDDFLLRLRGMFALAVYDKRGGPGRERLVLARDQLGIKPLLYSHVNGGLVFASEMKALLAGGLISPEMDPIALRMLLTYGSVYQPRTMLKRVKMLPPAHRLIVDQRGERLERYWSLGLNRRAGLRNRPYAELEEEVAQVLEESVRLQMVSDVPLGAFLSGGVDSSLLVALMTQAAGHRIKTFSVGFGDEGSDMDETAEAGRTAKFLGADHTRVVVDGADVAARIEHIAAGLDQPSVDGVNSYFVSLAARRAVTVAISGTGGDELFAGYPWFAQMALYQKEAQKEPFKAAARSLLSAAVNNRFFDRLLLGPKAEAINRARGQAGFIAQYANNYQIFGVMGAARMLPPHLRGPAQAGRSLAADLAALDELPRSSAVERSCALCLRGYTNNQLLRDIDAVSMAHSLEVRVPYLDVPLLDLSLSLPDSAKMGNLDLSLDPITATYRQMGSKKILIDAGRNRGLLPPGIDQQPKRGFAMPFADWLGGPLRDVFQDALSDRAIAERGWLNPQAAASVRERFLAGQLSWAQPWLLMMLELWGRTVLDKAPAK